MGTNKLNAWSLATFNMAAILSLRHLSITAGYGTEIIFFYFLAAITFFIPVSLACAELASAWPESGGIYSWTKKAFGNTTGVLAIWWLWMSTIALIPAYITFILGIVIQNFIPTLANNNFIMANTIILIMWIITTINLKGIVFSDKLCSIFFIIGTLIPGLFLIICGVIWIIIYPDFTNNLSSTNLLPDLSPQNISNFGILILSLCGIEIAAFHIKDSKNPQSDYQMANLISTVLILIIFIFSSLAIGIIVPSSELNVISGIVQLFNYFFEKIGIANASSIIAIIIITGNIASLNSWYVGPIKGLQAAAEENLLPKIFAVKNKNNVPIYGLIIQTILSSLITIAIIFMPNIEIFYKLLNVITVHFTLLMYIIVLLSVLYLRIKQPNHPRPFKIAGNLPGLYFIVGSGCITCLTVIIMTLVPEADSNIESMFLYNMIVFNTAIIMTIPCLIMRFIKR